ncbi:LLM class flavin-dependent oxidoreductase [Dactylosporangium sp. NPDC005555]|uniref:LLM class flavin-dependent oxidoreductase n=1 Tax=Dactylosporangium sp. NPDC005555 TaxID=3154889 RepID=UPI0033AFBB9E
MKLSILDQSPIGTGQSPAQALRNTVELAELADQLGYTRYWVAEHHAMHSHGGSAPEVLVAAIAARTGRIRVGSGGVLLSHYSPFKVAEVFRTLEALYPGRIDLGIGRSAGSSPIESYALRGTRGTAQAVSSGDDFDDKLVELLAFLDGSFPAGHPFHDVVVTPTGAGRPDVWLLGSSPRSGAVAAQLGLPYAYAHFINPAPTRAVFADHRARTGGTGTAILGIGVYCADTEAEAERVYATQRAFRRRLTRNDVRPVPSPEQSLLELADGDDPLGAERFEFPRYVYGTPSRVRDQILAITEATGAEEVIALATIYDHADRLRSYELLAQAFALQPVAAV